MKNYRSVRCTEAGRRIQGDELKKAEMRFSNNARVEKEKPSLEDTNVDERMILNCSCGTPILLLNRYRQFVTQKQSPPHNAWSFASINTYAFTAWYPVTASAFIFPDINLYRVSQEERTKLREGVPYVKLYRYNPKHLYPKLNGYGDNGQRSLKL